MKSLVCAALTFLLTLPTVRAQAPQPTSGAANPGQLSLVEGANNPSIETREVKIPAGTPVEIETAYTVSSLDVKPEELISFRVVVPLKVDGVTVIEKDSLVTGRVIEAKRGGHWGRAGKLSWIMQDVVAVDLTRIPLQARNDLPQAKDRVTGTSHSGEVATRMIVFGTLLWPIAPIVLINGFKRGENAVLPEGKRFIVFVKSDTTVKVRIEQQ